MCIRDRAYTDKRRFLIFDYCGNFEYFREHKEGYEARETKTLSENIFGKQIKIVMALQESTFAGEDYQAWRNELIETCHKQVVALNSELVSVKLRMQYVEKYKKQDAFLSISEGDKGELDVYKRQIRNCWKCSFQPNVWRDAAKRH